MSTYSDALVGRCADDRTGDSNHTTRNIAAARALAAAIQSHRQVSGAPMRNLKAGRIDTRNLHRVGVGDGRVFKQDLKARPQSVRVTILVDASSSMADPAAIGSPPTYTVPYFTMAGQVCRDLAEATETLPWVTADLAAFSTQMHTTSYFPLWQSGQPTDLVDTYFKVPMNGTQDGYAIAMALDEMQERIGSREQGLILIITDGRPEESSHVQSVVNTCRDRNVPVVAVAITDGARAAAERIYGRDNVVTFDGNPRTLARDMAKAIGRAI